jgi:protein-S-isoprenylcysteine O-methyltransferase Ste14
MAEARELLFRHRGTLLILVAAPIALGCIELPFSWIDAGVGLAILALAAALRLVAVRRIGKRARVAKSGAAHLLCEGPYARTRNPLYLANLGTAAGSCALAGLRLWSLPVVIFVLAVYQLVVRAEEETLRELFGERFDLYRQRVPRWLPRFTAAEPVDQLEAAPVWSWGEVLVRESPYLLGIAALGAGLVYIKLPGPGVLWTTDLLARFAARLSIPRWALVTLLVVVVALGEGVSTFLKRRRHALRKEWWARVTAEAEREGRKAE